MKQPCYRIAPWLRLGILLCAAPVLFPDTLMAAREPRYWPTRRITAQDAGISILLPSSSDPLPLSAIDVFQYEHQDTGERLEMYRPRDLWVRSQHLARWRDEFGNEVHIARVSTMLPKAFPREHVSRKQYEDALPAQESKWDTETLLGWVSDYMEAPAKPRPEHIDGIGANVKAYLVFRENSRVGYMVLPRGTKTQYFVAFLLKPEAMRDAAKGIRKSLSSLEIERPENKPKKDDAPSTVFQSRRVDRGNKSAEFQHSRERVIADIRNLDRWWFAETENYIIASDMGRKDRHLAKQIQEDIETLRQVYAQLAEPWGEPDAVSVIKVFGERENYVAYVDADKAWSGGLWMPLRKELVVSPVSPELGKVNEEAVLRTVYHEGFHQYVFYSLAGTTPAAWFNEGHAVLMEGCEVQGKRARLEEHPIFSRSITNYVKNGSLQVEAVLEMTYDDFYRADGTDEGRLRNYVTAWGIIYYLQKACREDRENPYRDVIGDYLKGLRKARNAEDATEDAFLEIDRRAFSRDCNAFWRSSSQRKRAARSRILERLE